MGTAVKVQFRITSNSCSEGHIASCSEGHMATCSEGHFWGICLEGHMYEPLSASTEITKVNETLGVCKRMSRMSIGRRKLLHVKSHTVKSYTAT